MNMFTWLICNYNVITHKLSKFIYKRIIMSLFGIIVTIITISSFSYGCYLGYKDVVNEMNQKSSNLNDNIENIDNNVNNNTNNIANIDNSINNTISNINNAIKTHGNIDFSEAAERIPKRWYGIWDYYQYLNDYWNFMIYNLYYTKPRYIFIFRENHVTETFLNTHCFPYWNNPSLIYSQIYDYAFVYDVIIPFFIK